MGKTEHECRVEFFDNYYVGHTLNTQSSNRLVNELAWLKTKGLSLDESLNQAHKEFGEVHILINMRDSTLVGAKARDIINKVWAQLGDRGIAPEKAYNDVYKETNELAAEFIDKAFDAYKECACKL